MASSLQAQEEGESVGTSTRMTEEEDTGTGRLSSCEQALRNDLILEKICGFLSLWDLKTCRLVNRQWKRASQDGCVQKCRPIGFFLENYEPGYAIHRTQEIPQFIQMISTSGDAFPCKHFLVDCRILLDTTGHEIVVDLFCAIAPIAEKLWLVEVISDMKRVRGDAPQNLDFPRLKSLKLSEREFSYRVALASNLDFCSDIILHSPQLATLDLFWDCAETTNLLIAMLESVQDQNIRRLHLLGPLNDTQFNTMAIIGLKLQCLGMNIHWKSILSEEGNGLTNFLSSQSSTLEVLHLRCNDPLEPELRISFPVMMKLTQLSFLIWRQSGIGLSRISYSELFPVLQSLSIQSFPELKLDSLFDFRMGPVNTVTSLELPWNLHNPAIIWQAARVFPNVKKLVVRSRAVVVMAVYEAWKKVEELTIKSTENGESADDVLTTYTRENQGSSTRQLDGNFQPVEFLHNLQILRIKCNRYYYHYQFISDHVCRLVLLKLRSLRCLDLSECSTQGIRKKMLQEMREKFTVIC